MYYRLKVLDLRNYVVASSKGKLRCFSVGNYIRIERTETSFTRYISVAEPGRTLAQA